MIIRTYGWILLSVFVNMYGIDSTKSIPTYLFRTVFYIRAYIYMGHV